MVGSSFYLKTSKNFNLFYFSALKKNWKTETFVMMAKSAKETYLFKQINENVCSLSLNGLGKDFKKATWFQASSHRLLSLEYFFCKTSSIY